jgi:CDP-diacylglycerol pyrophosphatase
MQNVQMTIDLISDRCVSLAASHHRGLSNGYEQAAKVLLRDRNKTTHSLLMPTTTINSLCLERQWLTRSVFKLIGQPSQW